MWKPTRRTFLGGLSAAGLDLVAPAAISVPAWAQTAPTHNISIAGTDVDLWMAAVSAHTVRISLIDASSSLVPTRAFAGKGLVDSPPPAVSRRIGDIRQSLSLRWGAIAVEVENFPLRVRLKDPADGIAQELRFDAANGCVSFPMQDRPIFGMGEGGHQFDRRGVIDQMLNGDRKPEGFVTGARSPIPWLISPAGWAIFFHHPMGTFDLTGPEGLFRPGEPAQPQDIFVVLSADPALIMRELAQLTGFPHLPPLWAFGHQQSHRTLSSPDEVMEEAKTFRTKQLPCDTMIYLGTGYAPSGWNLGHGSFAFNPKIFPHPKEMIQQFHEENFHVVLHVLNPPWDLHGKVNDVHSQDPDDAANYWPQHLPIVRTGIDGWWVDDGDELLPQCRLARNEMYWDGMRQARPNHRPFALHRNGYTGLQQYGWLWSGDIRSTWQALKAHIAVGMNTGLSGIPYWGTDTGGFFSTKELTAELYVRWFQFSSFCTLFRSHGRTWKLRLPWGWDTGDYGPVEDSLDMLPSRDELHHPEVEGICRKYLNLRYSLLPYLYSAADQAHRTGMPIMRALWLHYPTDAKAASIADQYLWGEHLLVAPVVEPGARRRATYLPAGVWYDYWTQEKLSGGHYVQRPVDLATLPLYVRAGAVLPTGPVKQYALEASNAPLTVTIYPGHDGAFTLYEDDGFTFDYERNIFSRIRFVWSDAEGSLAISLLPGCRMHPFTTTQMVVQVAGSNRKKTVAFTGASMRVSL
jgi:alpha-glucosidase (family GH31 glycosyl hydrolase)